jgi:voltage-gated potassium channel
MRTGHPGSTVEPDAGDGRKAVEKRRADLTPGARRRATTLSLLRYGSVAVVLVVLYYLAPLDRSLDAGSAIRFGLGLLALAAVVPWQVRSIAGSEAPWLRAANAVMIGLSLLLLLFASAYVVIARNVPDAFTEPLTRTDALYFTVTVFATVGFGDIAPRAEAARIAVMTQMIVGLIAVGVVVKALLGAARTSVERRAARAPVTRPPVDEDETR